MVAPFVYQRSGGQVFWLLVYPRLYMKSGPRRARFADVLFRGAENRGLMESRRALATSRNGSLMCVFCSVATQSPNIVEGPINHDWPRNRKSLSMTHGLLSSPSLHLMLDGVRSALATDDRCAPGHEIYGVRLYVDFKVAVRSIETALASRKEAFVPIAW